MEVSSDDPDKEEPVEGEAPVDSPVFTQRGEVIRSRDEPLPPPSHQVYKHPGGGRWMYTSRKRVLAVGRPVWANHIRNWSIEYGMPVPFAPRHSIFKLGENSMADRSLPVTVECIAHIDRTLDSTRLELSDIRQQVATATTAQRDHEHTTQFVIDEVAEAHVEIDRIRRQEVILREQVTTMGSIMTEILRQSEDNHRETARLRERLDRHPDL